MSSYDWEEMMKRDEPVIEPEFETFLKECVPELPPTDIVNEVTPWKNAMNRILWGMALTTITFKFWNLDYLLPMIGMFLMLFGFRTLREENKWFKLCWYLMIPRITYFEFRCIFDATIYRSILADSNMSLGLIVVNFLIVFIQIICFWKAIRTVQEKTGLPPRAKAAIVLFGWYVVMCYLGAMQYTGVLAYVLLIGYVCIIRSLWNLSKELTEAGYAIKPAQIIVSERKIVTGALLILAVGMSCGYLFFHSYPMDWQPAMISEDEKRQEIEQHLIKLGFPETVLADLSEEDILACDGALRVVVEANNHSVGEGRVVREETVIGYSEHTVYDREELQFIHIGVELPGERERWKIFHHFKFIYNPGFYGTESIQLWSCYRINPEAWGPEGEVTGQVLYDEDGQTNIASYASLASERYQADTIFWGVSDNTDVFADFSMPNRGENHRGYLSYVTVEMQDGWILDSWVNYSHQNSWLQYPVLTAKEKRKLDNLANMEPFKTIQDALQFYPNEEG